MGDSGKMVSFIGEMGRKVTSGGLSVQENFFINFRKWSKKSTVFMRGQEDNFGFKKLSKNPQKIVGYSLRPVIS